MKTNCGILAAAYQKLQEQWIKPEQILSATWAGIFHLHVLEEKAELQKEAESTFLSVNGAGSAVLSICIKIRCSQQYYQNWNISAK